MSMKVGERVTTPRGPGRIDEVSADYPEAIVRLDRPIMSKLMAGSTVPCRRARSTHYVTYHLSSLKPEIPHEA